MRRSRCLIKVTIFTIGAVCLWRIHALAVQIESGVQGAGQTTDIEKDSARTSTPASTPAPSTAAGATSPAGAGDVLDSRWLQLQKVHAEWDFWVVNLDKRSSRLACVMQEFNHQRLEVKRLAGVDGSQLQYGDLAFTSAGQPGHNGCLYSHIDFLLHSLGRADCVIPRYEKSVSPDKIYGPVQITVVNKTPIMLVAVKLGTDGELLPVPSANIEPHGAVTIERGRPGDRVVGDHGQRVDVRTRIDREILCLLRAHVPRRPDQTSVSCRVSFAGDRRNTKVR